MAYRTPRQAVEDILVSIGEISSIIGKREAVKALEDLRTRRAVERCLSIISEAARHIPATYLRRHPGIPWRNVKDTGNYLRHEYADVSAVILVDVVTSKLKILRRACESIREELDAKADA